MVPDRIARSFGEYEIVREIARGGMGAVYEARHKQTGAAVAIKTILGAGDERARGRFRREAELVARCDRHPGIVRIHSLGETFEGALFLVLELVRGEGLDALLRREKPLEPRRAAGLARDLARALGFIHERGIVHRDVKPSNILMDSAAAGGGESGAGGVPRLTDFGLAAARDVERLTRSGQFIGTPFYCSPEQARGESAGPGADAYSLGAVLFEMLAGVPPIEADTAIGLLSRLAEPTPVRDVRLVTPGVPAGLAHVVARALAKPIAQRYPNGNALADDLQLWLDGGTIAPPRGRTPVRLVVAAGGLALLVAGSVGVAMVSRTLRERRVAADVAHVALEKARAALERVQHLGAVASVGSAGQALLAEAGAEAERARTAATQARDPELVVACASVARAALVAQVEQRLALGQAADALATLDSLGPGDTGSTPAERLLRGRALLLLGRAPDAEREARAIEAAPGTPELRASAVELLADAQLAQSDPRGAVATLERAIALAPRRTRELKAKRAAALVGAGNDAGALADLVALVPDLGRLPEDRAANVALAPIAPALYRRALAEGATAAGDRDLELASRLAPPPPDLASQVAQACRRQFESLDASQIFERNLDTIVRLCGAARRAVEADPSVDLGPVWDRLGWTRVWAEKFSEDKSARLLDLVPRLEAAWPTNAAVLWLGARAGLVTHSRAAERAGWERLRRAASALPPVREGESTELVELARAIVSLGAVYAARLSLPVAEVETLRPAAERPGLPEAQRNFEMALAHARALDPERFEGEGLEIGSVTGGQVEVQYRPPGLGLSAGALLHWSEAAPGRALHLVFPSPRAGRQRITCVFTTGLDYSSVKITINGVDVEPDLDLMGNGGPVSRTYDVSLVEGRNELSAEILRSPRIQGGREPGGFGIDYLRILDADR